METNIDDLHIEVLDTAKEVPEKKVPTLKEYKEAMRVFYTRRSSTVVACGHKIWPTEEPKNNCQFCWFAYFQENGQTTQIADECFRKEGRAMLIKIRGEKFTKNFTRFMSTLAEYQALSQIANQAKVGQNESTTAIEGSGTRTTGR